MARRSSRDPGLFLAMTASVFLLTSCTPGTGASTGAPPLVVCGQTIWTGAEGAVVQDVSAGGTVTVASAGGDLFLKVSQNCSRGAVVTLPPQSTVQIVATATATDGRTAAIVLKPVRPDFSLSLLGQDGKTRTVRVSLSH